MISPWKASKSKKKKRKRKNFNSDFLENLSATVVNRSGCYHAKLNFKIWPTLSRTVQVSVSESQQKGFQGISKYNIDVKRTRMREKCSRPFET